MTLIIEDGSSVAGANSYVTAQEYIDWSGARFGYDRETAPTCEADAEGFILRGMDDIESRSYSGSRYYSDQALSFPRSGLYVDRVAIGSTSIHARVKLGLYEAAYSVEIGNSQLADVGSKIISAKLDTLSVQYSDKGSAAPVQVAIHAALRPFLASGGSFQMPTHRA